MAQTILKPFSTPYAILNRHKNSLTSPTTPNLTYCMHPLHSPLASPTTQLTFSLPQLYIQSTPSSQFPDTNIETENYKALNQSVTTFSTGQTSDTRTPIKESALPVQLYLKI
ncbi:hypothetical protein LOD99_9893 [Oopsacas minuta]|uniref:Uncharacterized protein n=1 Tax=Oopsacas minuta TaxID=111878 RepID=A0AAV7KRA8_9METZ|nr:hypothetical protein LOD99_9893 [Oopsacas minuta]